MEEMSKKTGATPTVPTEDLSGGKVQGIWAVTTILVKYTDGYGRTTARLAVVIPGGEVYFFTNDSIDMRPAQNWLKTAVQTRMAQAKSGSIEITEDSQVG